MGVDCLVSRICVSGVNRFVIYLGVIRVTHLKTRVAFLYLTLSENESQFSLENISADGAHCKIISRPSSVAQYPVGRLKALYTSLHSRHVHCDTNSIQPRCKYFAKTRLTHMPTAGAGINDGLFRKRLTFSDSMDFPRL